MSYIVLDLEFNQAYDFEKNKTILLIPSCRFEIIQIGAVKLDNNFNIIDKINLYIKPNLYKEIHPYVEKITGLSQEILKDKQSFKEAYTDFEMFLGDEEHIFCTWGSGDLKALYRNLSYYNMLSSDLILKYIDIQNLATKHIKYSKGGCVGLKTAIEILNIPIQENFHDALNDALYTAEIFKKISPNKLNLKVFNSKNVKKK
ncbi:3'-5' exonuclease [uncultured Tyzzerella sp.]|uniref:3'-5' exonuclease n=1 Tax=uncultured Tyzzerella sp. TaxID=2321398 RepID=UPI0029430157|nr:3'-5' exonuclease [uncultured Tyzzerella sp.]